MSGLSSVYKYILMDCAQKGWYLANFSFGDHFKPNILFTLKMGLTLCVCFSVCCCFVHLICLVLFQQWVTGKIKRDTFTKKVISLCKWWQFCLTCTNLKWGNPLTSPSYGWALWSLWFHRRLCSLGSCSLQRTSHAHHRPPPCQTWTGDPESCQCSAWNGPATAPARCWRMSLCIEKRNSC